MPFRRNNNKIYITDLSMYCKNVHHIQFKIENLQKICYFLKKNQWIHSYIHEDITISIRTLHNFIGDNYLKRCPKRRIFLLNGVTGDVTKVVESQKIANLPLKNR